MAENIYSKGTRVWFPDKEQGWISAEVTSVTRGTDDAFKLTFGDERGKVRGNRFQGFENEISHLVFSGNHHQHHRKRHQGRERRFTPTEESASPRDSRRSRNALPLERTLRSVVFRTLSAIRIAYPAIQCCIRFGIAMHNIVSIRTVELC